MTWLWTLPLIQFPNLLLISILTIFTYHLFTTIKFWLQTFKAINSSLTIMAFALNDNSYQPPTFLAGPEVRIYPSENITANRYKWRLDLMWFFWDHRNFSETTIQEEVDRNWDLAGRVGVQKIDDRIFAFHFDSQLDRADMISQSPINIQGALLTLETWYANFPLHRESFTENSLWFFMKGIPLDYITEEIINDIATTTGPIERIEFPTSASERGGPVRAKVQVDLSAPLMAGTYIRLLDNEAVWVQFSYEKIFKLCSRCGRVGHNEKDGG